MGIAVLSGMIDSLDGSSSLRKEFPKWESHTPGTLTPEAEESSEAVPPTIPNRFIACVTREESAKKLRGVFANLGPMGSRVEVLASRNLQAVESADVVLLWCVSVGLCAMLC